jgi:hypothetical protein
MSKQSIQFALVHASILLEEVENEVGWLDSPGRTGDLSILKQAAKKFAAAACAIHQMVEEIEDG